jgi:hypothetical protein
MRLGKRDVKVETVLFEQPFELSRSAEQRYWDKHTKCPRCKRWIIYTVTYEPGGRVRRIRNPKHPAALVECPRCHDRWFFFQQPVEIEFLEGEQSSTIAHTEEIELDNSRGTSPLLRTRTISEEWTHTYEVEREETNTTGLKAGLGIEHGPNLEVTAEQAIKERYSISDQKKETYSEELSFEVPPGVRRNVRVTFKEVWEQGRVRLALPSTARDFESDEVTKVELPFRVVVDVVMDVAQEDTGRPPEAAAAGRA